MGTKGSKDLNQKNATQLPNFNSENGDVYEEYQQITNCCGVEYVKLSKVKLVWENSFIKNCQGIKSEYRWANEMIDIVKSIKLPRAKYIAEVNEIKKITVPLVVPVNETLLTPGEVEEFKKNLKKSVLLSFGQAKQQMHETTKITTSMNPAILQKVSQNRKTRFPQEKNRMSVIKMERSVSNSQTNSNRGRRSSLRKSIMSFVDDTISSVFGGQDKEVSKENAKAVQNFLNFTMIIEKHLTDERNILCRIQRSFANYMKKYYSDPKIAGRDIEFLTNNVKQFLVLMRETIYDFYNLASFNDEELHALITNEENVLTIVTAVLFKDREFYQVVFNAIVEFNMENDETLNKILAKLEKTTPQFFEIKPEYCLNELTLKKNFENLSADSTESKIENFDMDSLSKMNGNETPYSQCMEILREMERSKTPIGKMKTIMSCSEKITNCIANFYNTNGFKADHWVLDADQILSIFCYILANAKIPNLHTHLFILENFSTDHQLISVTGYYYSVLTCALQQLEMHYRDLIE